jgi:primosomal protein N'
MTYKTILSTITLSAASIFIGQLYAQELPPITKSEYNHMDSLQSVYKRDQVQTQKTQDVEKMSDAKTEQSDAKAKAKEAERIHEEAADAAKESKDAVKTEKKAQKLRKKADKQAEKAEAARDKSDLN